MCLLICKELASEGIYGELSAADPQKKRTKPDTRTRNRRRISCSTLLKKLQVRRPRAAVAQRRPAGDDRRRRPADGAHARRRRARRSSTCTAPSARRSCGCRSTRRGPSSSASSCRRTPASARAAASTRSTPSRTWPFTTSSCSTRSGLEEVILGGVSLGGWIAAEFAVRWPERVKKLWIADAPGLWVEEAAAAATCSASCRTATSCASCCSTIPHGHMATLIIQDNPDEEKLLAAYQTMTVLARLVWERPYDPKLAAAAAPRRSARRCSCGAKRPAGAAGLWRGVSQAYAAGGVEADPELRPPADVRDGAASSSRRWRAFCKE